MVIQRFLRYCLIFSALMASNAIANEQFSAYLKSMLDEAAQQGISSELIKQVRPHIAYRQSVIKSDKNQPEKRLTLDTYLKTRVPDWKVKQAVSLYKEHHELLQNIEQEFGVQGRFIVALWGNESNFGRIQGNHPVLSSLASLAFEGRREKLFRKEFFAALSILEQGHVGVENMLGSWAGAMGQTQFMPSSFNAYAVDYDGDGKRNIWQSIPDALASIANYLSNNGWNSNYTWGRQVRAPLDIDARLIGLSKNNAKPMADWQALGVRRFDNRNLPTANISAWLIMPDGIDGRSYLVYRNFQTLMIWNRSQYFGISVSHLAEKIKKGLRET